MAAGDKSESGDAPLIDLNEASIKKLIARAKRRGYITYDELNEALPQDQMSSEQIEDIMSAISARWASTSSRATRTRSSPTTSPRTTRPTSDDDGVGERPGRVEKKKETIERTDDPVRMYLREMGAVELLSREGEIAIAKRIEAGRDTMILGLCESPITFHAIIQWSEALNNGEMQLREILDLDAMLSKEPAPEKMDRGRRGRRRRRDQRGDRRPFLQGRGRASRKRRQPTRTRTRTASSAAPAARVEEEEEDNTLSLAQMEAQLKPEALEKFASITDAVQEVREDPGRAARRAGRGRRLSRGQGEASTSSCARSSPPRSRACSSTRPRSNTWSTTSMPSTAA